LQLLPHVFIFVDLWNSIATNGDMGKQIMTTLAYFMDCCKQVNVALYTKYLHTHVVILYYI